MNTKKVAELLAEIDRAQDNLKTLEKEASGVAKRIAAQNERIVDLKRALGAELAEVVAAPASKTGRRRGLSDAVLSSFADGRQHSTDEVAAKLAQTGFDDRTISSTLAVLTRKGKLVRVSRGVYRPATT